MFLISYFYRLLVAPRSVDESFRHFEFVLNVVLLTSMVLEIVVLVYGMFSSDGDFLIWPFLFLLLFFVLFYGLGRLGYVRLISYGLVFLYAFLIVVVTWQQDHVELELVFAYAVIPVIAGVFINRRAALVGALVGTTLLLGFAYNLTPELPHFFMWNLVTEQTFAALVYGLVLGVLMIKAWMSNHDIKHFLQRGGSLEVVMLQDDGTLIRQVPSAELTDLYRYAEFGRLAGGLFHDMANPLTALTLYLERLRPKLDESQQSSIGISLEKVIQISKKLEEFIGSLRLQAGKDTEEVVFCAEDEVVQAAQVFLHKMQKTGVSVRVRTGQRVMIYGSPLKFYQVALNLISNAIDAYQVSGKSLKRKKLIVDVELHSDNGKAVLMVRDFGSGIEAELLEKIFQPFYTTKGSFGTGIGLVTTKDIVERHFKGAIVVESDDKRGTVFWVRVPLVSN